jgi:hypothetical protein
MPKAVEATRTSYSTSKVAGVLTTRPRCRAPCVAGSATSWNSTRPSAASLVRLTYVANGQTAQDTSFRTSLLVSATSDDDPLHTECFLASPFITSAQ